MALRGWANFAWQADYGQFYLIDSRDADFQAPIEITAEMERRSLFAPATCFRGPAAAYPQPPKRFCVMFD